MPGSQHGPSIKNPKVYDALRRQGMSKSRAARISNAARFKAADLAALEAYVDAPDYDPRVAAALASCVPELPRVKGESLGPGITRIRGNLCNVHGRYGPCDAALGGTKPKKGRAPAKTAQQRQAEREAARAANRAQVAAALADADASLGPTGVAAVLAAADGGPIADGPALAALGYAEQNPDGSYRLTPEARQLARAASRGDARAALDADGRAQARAAKRAEQQAKRDQKKLDQEKKPKGGGGKGKKEKPDASAQAATNRASVAKQLQVNLDALNTRATGGSVSAADRADLTRRGLLDADGEPTDAAQQLLTAAEKGDVRKARALLVAAGRAAAAPGADKPAPAPADIPTDLRPTPDPAIQATRRRRARQKRLAAWGNAKKAQRTLPASWRAKAARPDRKWGRRPAPRDGYPDQSQFAGYTMEDWDDTRPDSFYKDARLIVYKTADGTPRWLARSTTAYRDRDGEILSVAALDADSQRMTATKQYGPLRWWHVGKPDPGNPAAPWGPGLDLGMCDFSMQIGLTRVESGTFKSAAIARAVARAADGQELSPGFFHPPGAPDAGGVFHQIRTFERSLVPTRYARASNLFTGLTVKETRMDITEIERRYKAAIAELGLSADQAQQLGAALVASDKSAQQAGIAFKSAAEAPAVYTAPDGTPGLIQDGRWVALKAAQPPRPPAAQPPAAAAAAPPVVEVKAPGDEANENPADEGSPEDLAQDAADYLGDMTVADFEAMLDARIGPLIKALDIAGKMGSHIDELKSMVGGYATKEQGTAAQLAATQQELAALKTQVADLAGDAPRILAGGYRASQAPATVVADGDARLKEASPGADPIMASFGSFLTDLGLTPGA